MAEERGDAGKVRVDGIADRNRFALEGGVVVVDPFLCLLGIEKAKERAPIPC